MKIAIVLNGISRKKKLFYNKIFPLLNQQFEVQIFETQHAVHAIELASSLAKENIDYILAAGGDGTLNQVVNGILLNTDNKRFMPSIGIIPLGTGNDFAKMCGIGLDVNQIFNLLRQNKPQATDIGKINCIDDGGNAHTRYFINVCSVGMGPEVVKRLAKSDRSLGPTLTYLKAITSTFFTHRPQEITVTASNWEWKGKARVLAIANGKSFGNSMFIAPDALPDDGIFSTFLAGEIPLLKFLLFLQMIKGKKKIKDNQIMYNECASLKITSKDECAIEAEGEWMGWLPAKIEMQNKYVNFLR